MRLLKLIPVAFACAALPAFPTQAGQLNVPVVIQQTPVWCWAAAGEMVLRYYGAQSINPYGNYQCGVVATAAPGCWQYCGACISTVGTAQNFVQVLRNYADAHAQLTGVEITNFSPNWEGELDEDVIIDQIDSGYPVLAGISPSGPVAPNGWGLSQHVVVITGYEDAGNEIELTINDPYPYPVFLDPYVSAGGVRLRTGRYRIAYSSFLENLAYQNSITFN